MASSPSPYEASIASLKASLLQISATKSSSDITVLLGALFTKLSAILTESVESNQKSELVANTSLSTIEQLFTTKNVSLSIPIQTLIGQLYDVILSPASCPGYIVRNVFNSFLVIANAKTGNPGARECAFSILSRTMVKRFSDCGSLVTDIITTAGKLSKCAETPIRIAAFSSLNALLEECGKRFSDTFPEIIKFCTKPAQEKSADLRAITSRTVALLAQNSNGFSSVTSDALLAIVLKGLEDDIQIVQNESAAAVATIFAALIRQHVEDQMQAKLAQARGSDTVSKEPTRRSSISKLTAAVTMKRKLLDDNDFQTVLNHIMKQASKATGLLRSGYFVVLKYLLSEIFSILTKKEIEDSMRYLIEYLKDPAFVSISHEEMVILRTHISFVIRSSLVSNMNETDQIDMCRLLIQFTATNVETKNENEIQLALDELGHIVSVIGEASVSIVEETQNMCILLLRNPNLSVRMAAASVLSNLALVIPIIAVGYLRDGLANSITQAGHIAKSEGIDVEVIDTLSDVSHVSQTIAAGSRKRTAKETERLQRLYFFHGQTLLITCILKNESKFLTGIPNQLVAETLDFGIQLLRQFQRCPMPNRHVLCSLVRAGGHIIASCMAVGYSSVFHRLEDLVDCCYDLLQETSVVVPETTRSEELMYEIIGVEAALICIASLLWHFSLEISREGNIVAVIVDGLESAFRAAKGKYQQKFRQHFRFRALHVLLLECFSWLPPGSYPNSSQQVFVEALRVLRDGLAAGYECSNLHCFIHPEWSSFLTSSICRSFGPSVTFEHPSSETLLMLRLEKHSTILQKRECEAFLSAFGNASGGLKSRIDDLSLPCASLDARTIDAAINAVSKIFTVQSPEYQEKAIQLCSQAIAQYAKTGSLGMFSSEDERRKRDQKNYLIFKNVVCTLSAIVTNLPNNFVNLPLPWIPLLIDQLTDMLGNVNLDIKSAASNILVQFVTKNLSMSDSIILKLIVALRAGLEKRSDILVDFIGHVTTISLFGSICIDEKLKVMVQSLLLESINRLECSLSYRSLSLFAMTSYIQSRGFGHGSQSMRDDLDLMSQICLVVESQIVSIGTMYIDPFFNIDLLLISLLKLLKCALSIVLYLDPTSFLVPRFIAAWNVVQASSPSDDLFKENIEFLSTILAYPTTILDLQQVSNILIRGLKSRQTLSSSVLKNVALSVKLLSMKNAHIIRSSGLDLELFRCLEYSIRVTNQCKHQLWWGFEVKRGLDDLFSDAESLQTELYLTIESIMSVQIQLQPDLYAVRWLMFFRALLLNLRRDDSMSTLVAPSPTRDDEADDGGDDEFHSASPPESPVAKMSNVVSAAGGGVQASTGTVLSPYHYANSCRDEASQRAATISSARSKLKSLILKFAKLAVAGISDHPSHTDLALARKDIQLLISKGEITSANIEFHPLYASFYVQDIVNFACAAATYSVDDKQLTSIQLPAMHLLAYVCSKYLNFVDPDATNISEISSGKSEKYLGQYISQIVSAVRPCLSVKWLSQLQWQASNVIFHLFYGGFLSDKVLVKRLGKLFIGSYEVPDLDNLSVVRPLSAFEVADEVSTIEQIITSANLAKIFVLSGKSSYLGEVDTTTKSILLELFEGNILEHLDYMWLAVCFDAARVLQGTRIWPQGSIELDSRRGGMLYIPSMNLLSLQKHLEAVLPICLAAAAASKSVPTDKKSRLFAIAKLALNDTVREISANTGTSSISRGHLEAESDVIVLLGAFTDLAIVSSGIQSAAWASLLKYIISELNFDSATGSRFQQTIDLLDKIVDQVSLNHCQDLWVWLWISVIYLIHKALPGFFDYQESEKECVVEGSCGFCICPILTRALSDTSDNLPFPIKLVEILNKLAQRSQCSKNMFIYALNLLTAIGIRSASSVDSAKLSGQVLDKIIECFESLVFAKLVEGTEELCDLILNDLTSIFSLRQRQMGRDDAVIHTIFQFWRILLSKYPMIENDPCIVLQSLYIRGAQSSFSVEFMKSLVNSNIRFIKSDPTGAGKVLASKIFPPLLMILNSVRDIEESVQLSLTQILFLYFTTIEETQRNLFVVTILPVICESLRNKDESSPLFLFCGKGLTHLARTCQEAFKESVILISVENRSVLQAAMAAAVKQEQLAQQQNGGDSGSGGRGSGGGQIKKLDIAKFQKPTTSTVIPSE